MTTKFETDLRRKARELGVTVTMPIHESYQLDLPEGMSLMTFVCSMAQVLPSPLPLAEGRLRFEPKRALHPGELLQEYLDDLGWSYSAFARRLDGRLTSVEIEAICRGNASITLAIASLLEVPLARPSFFWLNLQKSYDAFKAK